MEENFLNLIFEVATDVCISTLSSSSSSPSTESEEEQMETLCKEKRRKIVGFVSAVVPKYSQDVFREHFRLTRTSVQFLKDKLEPFWLRDGQRRRPKTDFEKAILLTLWTLGNQESFRGVADRFGVSISTAHKTFTEICRIFCKLQREFIKWPIGAQADKTVEEFLLLGRFPNVIGCVDGTHIQLPGPANDNSYYNRKGVHSIVLQAVCNANLKFIDIYAGWPGSVHDAKVWTSSPLYKRLKTPQGFIKPEYHILGDSAYPIDVFLMKPYKDNGHLTAKQSPRNN